MNKQSVQNKNKVQVNFYINKLYIIRENKQKGSNKQIYQKWMKNDKNASKYFLNCKKAFSNSKMYSIFNLILIQIKGKLRFSSQNLRVDGKKQTDRR